MKRIALLCAIAAAGVAAFVLLRPPNGATHPTGSTNWLNQSGATHPTDAGNVPDAAGVPPMHQPLGDTGGDAGVGGTSFAEVSPDRTPSVGFEQEARDTTWANEQERELTMRLRKLVDVLAKAGTPIDIDSIECHRTLCRIGIHARDEAALGKMYGQLETTDGLYGWADNLVLEPVERAADGQVTARVLASFDRE